MPQAALIYLAGLRGLKGHQGEGGRDLMCAESHGRCVILLGS